jgi:Tol biopolymer transport system component
MPAFGGYQRKISSFGYHPQWSPDGSKILFTDSYSTAMGTPCKLYLATQDQNAPQEIVLPEFHTDFLGFEWYAWHPDGRRISFFGRHKTLASGFWTVPLDGGKPVKSEIAAGVQKVFDQFSRVAQFRWAPTGKALYFNAVSRQLRNLWRVIVDPETLRWVAGPERLTAGQDSVAEIAISRDGRKLAYAAHTENTSLWSLPLDGRTGQIRGQGLPVSEPGTMPCTPDISSDGKKVVFVQRHQGTDKQDLWEQSLDGGRRKLLAEGDDHYDWTSCWSPDGTRVAIQPWAPE